MPSRYQEQRSHLDVVEAQPAKTWLEAAEQHLERQASAWREKLYGSSLDRGEAKKHLASIGRIRLILEADPQVGKDSKKKLPLQGSDDINVRRVRRAELLTPKGWREGIRARLVAAAEASEARYIADTSPIASDSDMVDAIELRSFVAQLDFVASRGEESRAILARQAMKVEKVA